ncbi:MAG: hypothetical protein JEZ04_06035 [Spirochaetales bacterium]|nr:hypothetical protein [Spirochaetales bacterium]
MDKITFSRQIPIILIILITCTSIFLTGCEDEIEAPVMPPYTGPSTMIDDFEIDFYETDESIHEEDLDPLYIIEQEGRRGHWVSFLFPHPNDTLIPDSSISLTHEAFSSMPPTYTADGKTVTSERAMHLKGVVGNPEGTSPGYIKVLTDLATNALWISSSDYVFPENYLLFYARAESPCSIWVALPAMADGSYIHKGCLVELTTDWTLISIDLNNCYLSYEPETKVVIEKALQLVFYLSSNSDHLDVAEGETKAYDIWIDDIRLSNSNIQLQ